jgi:hypothetical protein
MSYMLRIEELIDTYFRIIRACQSHYNGMVHLLSASTPLEYHEDESLLSNVEVTIEEKKTEEEFETLHIS